MMTGLIGAARHGKTNTLTRFLPLYAAPSLGVLLLCSTRRAACAFAAWQARA